MKSTEISKRSTVKLLFISLLLILTHCKAGEECSADKKPVCGDNGKTYDNACFAERAGIKLKHQGVCGGNQIMCPTVYKPVCGENNKTYSNACFARAAGVNVIQDGSCK